MKNWDKHFASYEEFVAACDAEPIGYWDTKGNYHLPGNKQEVISEKTLTDVPVTIEHRTVIFGNGVKLRDRTIFGAHKEGIRLVGYIIRNGMVFDVEYIKRLWRVISNGIPVEQDSRKGWY